MTTEDHTPQLREKPISSSDEIRRSRRRAVVLAASTIITILSIIYASIKKTEADAQRELALKLQEQAMQALQEAKMQQMVAIQAKHELEQTKLSEQNRESDRNNPTIEQLKKELEAQRKIAEQNLAIARMNEKQAMQMQHLAAQHELAAKKALEDCQNKKQ